VEGTKADDDSRAELEESTALELDGVATLELEDSIGEVDDKPLKESEVEVGTSMFELNEDVDDIVAEGGVDERAKDDVDPIDEDGIEDEDETLDEDDADETLDEDDADETLDEDNDDDTGLQLPKPG
jgi:hypothetical protein